jgi:4-hydroxy-2-oxoheptanedioate aldolase
MPKRINRAIELLEQKQPVFYTGGHTGAELTEEAGRRMARTWADYINVGMEHGAFDMVGLESFMRGMVAGGPTASGHRTPAVIVEVPVNGVSADAVRANAWQFRQILARGVHGLLLCHAESPGAVQAFVEGCRFPFQTRGVGHGLDVGRRGAGGQGSAAPIWGISSEEYLEKADPWPLNPEDELLLGVKIENRRALANAELTLRVPGIAFAEWGIGDMGMSFGYRQTPREPLPTELREARARVFAACEATGVAFLDGMTLDEVTRKIDEGVKISSGGAQGEVAAAGRAHTRRTMPV